MKPLMLRLRKNLVGLDIDGTAVRMVQLRRENSTYAVVRAGITPIAPWGNDPHLRRLHTVRALTEGLRDGGFRTKFAVCGLRGPEVVVRDFTFPALPREEIQGAVELESSQICPFPAEKSTLDYQITSNRDQRTVGFWVAATKDLIETTRQLVSEAGLHCALVDVAGLALLNLLDCGYRNSARGSGPDRPSAVAGVDTPVDRSNESSRSRPALLNLGDSCATIAVADAAGRPFVRDIGSSPLVDSPVLAVAARGNQQDSFTAENNWAAQDECRATTSDSLVEHVATTLRYYTAQNGSVNVDRLLVCGATVAAESLAALRQRLDLEVEPWNSLTECGLRIEEGALRGMSVDDPLSYGPCLALAAGLAMRSI